MTRTKKDYKEWKRFILERHCRLSALVDAVWNSFHEEAVRDGYTELMEEDELDMLVRIESLLQNAGADNHIFLPLFLDYQTLVGMDITNVAKFLSNNWFVLEHQNLNADIGTYVFIRNGVKRLEIHTENNIVKSIN